MNSTYKTLDKGHISFLKYIITHKRSQMTSSEQSRIENTLISGGYYTNSLSQEILNDLRTQFHPDRYLKT